ncbi:phage holin family protein [Vaginella massiliensis]|uniref:phage holin family protein n=1 Tax=Vaginella massiliensis TaxID=1816680 RepID=UPI000838890B|nr:phage holin family protein [Vaginella massiliensis]
MFKDLKSYINNRITLTKYEVVDSVSHMIAGGVYGLIIAVFSLFLILLGSIAVGFVLGQLFDDNGIGFLVVTGLYLLFLILCILFRKKIKLLLTNIVIANSMNAITNQDDDEDEEED